MGLTLHEVAHNRFPFPPEGEPPLSGPIELLNFIVAQPAPRLIDSPAEGIVWSPGAQDFLSQWSVLIIFDCKGNADLFLAASFGTHSNDRIPATFSSIRGSSKAPREISILRNGLPQFASGSRLSA